MTKIIIKTISKDIIESYLKGRDVIDVDDFVEFVYRISTIVTKV